MSIDLNTFFRLGLETTDQPIDQSLIIQQRTAPDNINTLQNKITFKIPKTGVLTRDSMLKVNLKASRNVSSTSRLNLLNGILGSIKRVVLKADNRIITDREFPSYSNTNYLYSRYTNIEMLNYWKPIIGCGLALDRVEKDLDDGCPEVLAISKDIIEYDPYDVGNENDTPDMFYNDQTIDNIVLGDTTRSWGVPLWLLSPFFLKNSLPVFLMRSTRDLILEITFHNDTTQFILSDVQKDNNALQIDLNNLELCSTHIIQSPEVESAKIEEAMTKPLQYAYNDEYLVKYSLPSGTEDIDETIRINMNTRRLNRLLMCFKPIRSVNYDQCPLSNQVFGEQLSTAFGNQSLMIKMNGVELFQQPITSDPTLFHMTTLYNGKMPLQFTRHMTSYNSHMAQLEDTTVEAEERVLSSNQMRGTLNYLGVDLTNGNREPLLSSTVQSSPLEINYKTTRNTQINHYPVNQLEHMMLIYPQVFKQLSITPKMVNVSY